MAKYRPSWGKCFKDVLEVLLKPNVLLMLLYIMWVFGFGIGINVTNVRTILLLTIAVETQLI